MRRAIKWSLLAFLTLLVMGGVFAGYGIYRIYYGRHVYETTPPTLPAGFHSPTVLIFSKTNGFRHDAGIKAANAALQQIAEKRGWSILETENGAAFTPDLLAKFKATVWNNTSGDVLNSGQRAAFKSYIENGGGFVGIHAAGGDPHYDWPWYVHTLIGAQFIGHPMNPQFQSATVHLDDPSDPILQGVPNPWRRVDEWYSFDVSPRRDGVHVLATIDESTYNPTMFWKDIHMGSDHPVMWKHCVGQGRVFYSALGHQPEAYSDPVYLGVLANAIAWSAGLTGSGCEK